MTKKVAVKPPEYTLKILTDFSLRNLEKTFTIADFERPLKPRHVQKIVVAILNNEFFDNIIGVFMKRNGQYEIIDGQHRIEALGILRDAHDLTRYNLVLRIFPERLARKIYRRINLGQSLKMQEHLRALDNDRHPFFLRLRPYFLHYNDGKFPKFEMILNALYYAKNGSPRAVRSLLLDRMFHSITARDLTVIITFSRAMHKLAPILVPKMRPNLYRYAIYRNIFRVGYENIFEQYQWENLIQICKTDKVIVSLQKEQKAAAVRRIYSYIVEQLGPQMGMDNLKKIERTGSQAKLVLSTSNAPFSHLVE